jgi:Fe-S-cluster-containing hydrogenase component 2
MPVSVLVAVPVKWRAWFPIRRRIARRSPDTFLPRIHVIKGVNISTAAICRQCEDAPCANVCPNGAIKREKGFVHVMQERCIGCKTCVVPARTARWKWWFARLCATAAWG